MYNCQLISGCSYLAKDSWPPFFLPRPLFRNWMNQELWDRIFLQKPPPCEVWVWTPDSQEVFGRLGVLSHWNWQQTPLKGSRRKSPNHLYIGNWKMRECHEISWNFRTSLPTPIPRIVMSSGCLLQRVVFRFSQTQIHSSENWHGWFT